MLCQGDRLDGLWSFADALQAGHAWVTVLYGPYRVVWGAVSFGVIGVDLQAEFSGVRQEDGHHGLAVVLDCPVKDTALEVGLGQETAAQTTHDAGQGATAVSMVLLGQGESHLGDATAGLQAVIAGQGSEVEPPEHLKQEETKWNTENRAFLLALL